MSDHLSSGRALRDPVVDLTDLFAFPTPGVAGRLSLVLNVFPNAQTGTWFSDAVAYRLRFRSATLHPGSEHLVQCADQELVLSFSFSDLEDGRQTATCTWTGGHSRSFVVGDLDSPPDPVLRLYAGLRLDPFFMDVARDVETRRTGKLAFATPGTNAVEGHNVLSIVVDLDVLAILGDLGPLVAVVAETTAVDDPSNRFERFGRPEIKNLALSVNGNDPVNTTIDLRELYNQEDAFDLGPDYRSAFRDRVDANVRYFDQMDGKTDWTPRPDGTFALTTLLLDDFLLVDVTKPYAEDGMFLSIESAALKGETHTTCGGRPLNDDVIDTLYTLLVTAGIGRPVSDGVPAATRRAGYEFPYLQDPNPSPPPIARLGIRVGAGQP